MLPRVFELFTQVGKHLDRSQGGLGIGLALVKRLVEMHGGTVAAESAGPGRGSTFSVRLPMRTGEPTDPTRQVGESPSGTGAAASPLRILVVDDNTDSAESLSMLLGLLGHEVRVAFTGPSGVETARAFRPDVVVLDIGLPGMNGYEVARVLRGDRCCASAVLVALTGWGAEEDRKQSQEVGFDFHLTKPVEPARMGELLAQACLRRL